MVIIAIHNRPKRIATIVRIVLNLMLSSIQINVNFTHSGDSLSMTHSFSISSHV